MNSLEIPQNYGGQFHVNEDRMNQIYNSTRGPTVPSTSFTPTFHQQQVRYLLILMFMVVVITHV